jgi:hypothetical protein
VQFRSIFGKRDKDEFLSFPCTVAGSTMPARAHLVVTLLSDGETFAQDVVDKLYSHSLSSSWPLSLWFFSNNPSIVPQLLALLGQLVPQLCASFEVSGCPLIGAGTFDGAWVEPAYVSLEGEKHVSALFALESRS